MEKAILCIPEKFAHSGKLIVSIRIKKSGNLSKCWWNRSIGPKEFGCVDGNDVFELSKTRQFQFLSPSLISTATSLAS